MRSISSATAVTRTLIASYPAIADNMTGHCNIAPDRKRTRSCLLTGRAFALCSPLVAQADDMTLFTTLLVLIVELFAGRALAARSSAGGAIPSDYIDVAHDGK